MKHFWRNTAARAIPGMIAVLLALTSAPAAPVALAATVYVVDDDQGECTTTYNDGNFATPLQKAIDDAIANNVHTIQVCAGTYDAFWVTGYAGGLKIVAQNPNLRPEIDAPSGTNTGTIVLVESSKNVVLDGLYINGEPFLDTAGGVMTGVSYHNATGTIQNTVITHVRATLLSNAAGTAIDILDDNNDGQTSVVSVKNNLVSMFDSFGVVVRGPVKATISGNQFDGANGDTTEAPVSGIQVRTQPSGTPTGSISKNLINFTVRGIWLLDISNMKITGNTIRQSVESAVEIDSFCTQIISGKGTAANKNLVSGNTFVKMPVGVFFAVAADGSFPSQCNPRADQNSVLKNKMVVDQLTALRTMVYIETSITGSGFVPGATKNKVSGNTGAGYNLAFTTNDPANVTNTSVSGNKLVHP